jgi:hopene-associated glycosyltransferase HpnB
MLYPPAWIAASDRKTAAAAGGCILIRPSALDRIGGIAAIRGELIDDCALARRVKATSGRIWLGTTTTTRSLREYRSWRDIEQMISRTAFTQLHYSCALLAVTTLAMFLTFLAPLALLFSGYIPAGLGLASWLLMSFCFLPTLRLYRRSSLWAPLLPGMALFYLSATIHSALLHWAGRGGSWKGRIKER